MQISKYTHNSNRKGKTVKSFLSKEEAEKMLTSKCFYCGKENAMGIDRIDSSKDYTLDNCVPCCGMCNIMKINLTQISGFLKLEKFIELTLIGVQRLSRKGVHHKLMVMEVRNS